VTADNASNNSTMGATIAKSHRARSLTWDEVEDLLGCMAHIVQLGIRDFMAFVTKTSAIETAATIWEYDPSD
ncbi:hypothetical protein FOMPIDRAFT_8907, partial [Fomitopsis schrenkii]